jgi:DMSO/TMAO reductase YedYZ molybdopterin-dependent catalytic subunit
MTERQPRPAPPSGESRDPAWPGMLAGVVAVSCGIAAGELLAGLFRGVPSPIGAMASLATALVPAGLAFNPFGTAGAAVLDLSLVGLTLVAGALAGRTTRQGFGTAFTAFGVIAALSLAGAIFAELTPLPEALVSALAVGLASCAVLWLLDAELVRLEERAEEWESWNREEADGDLEPQQEFDPFRRQFLIRSVAVLVGAVLAGGLGRYLLVRSRPAGPPIQASLPAASQTVAPLTTDQELSGPGLSSLVTSNKDFYRVDVSLLVPQIDASTWQLKVSGMVDHPKTYAYGDLQAMPLFEQYVTLACVSNEVGGSLVGNALWTGVRLKDVLAAAGVQLGATQIVGRAIDGFTVGFPTAWALDPAREPMVALGMNRQSLPAEHGYPARLIVPGLYGYVSATKWLSEIELTTREAFNAYWVTQGWAKDGPILTQSRIDHPGYLERVPAGPTWIDGVAWASDRGVSKVEVRIDGGAWSAAELSRAISKATWVQWMLPWQASAGSHTIEVRATDGNGVVQTSDVSDPYPDGARGHQTIQVTVG